jgi:predicted dehydrogenase
MKKLRIAVVGCGAVSGGHIRAWCAEADRAEITALVDVQPEFAQARKNEFALGNAVILTDMAQALARDDVDVVDLCTPSHQHADQIGTAMEAGRHIVTEKPTGYNLEECRRLRWHAQRHPDLKVAVAYSLRYYPLNIRVRELIREGAIGSILHAAAAHNHPHDFSREETVRPGVKNWLADKGGQYLPASEMTGATHGFDLTRYLFGDVRDVFAMRGSSGTFAMLRFESGTIVETTSATASKQGIATPHVLCIQGTEGTIYTQNEYQYSDEGVVHGYNGYLVTDGKPVPIDVQGADTSHGDANRTRNFIDAVTLGKPLICDLEDGIRTSELLHAIWDSHNLEIRVPVHRAYKSG